MNEQLLQLWNKVVENKQTVIKVGSAVLGAVVGFAVATIVNDVQTSENDRLVQSILSDDDEQ